MKCCARCGEPVHTPIAWRTREWCTPCLLAQNAVSEEYELFVIAFALRSEARKKAERQRVSG